MATVRGAVQVSHRSQAEDLSRRAALRELGFGWALVAELVGDAHGGDQRRGRLPRLHRDGAASTRAKSGRRSSGACGSARRRSRTSRASRPRSTTRTGPIACARSSLRPGGGEAQVEEYYFTYARRLGARKVFAPGRAGTPGLRFAVWAPNARRVEVVFGDPANGYIADDGHGIDPSRAPLPMTKRADGIWETRRHSRTSPPTRACRTCTASRTRRGAPSIARTSSRASRSDGARRTPDGGALGRRPERPRRHQELQPDREPRHGGAGRRAARRAARGPDSRGGVLGPRVHAGPARAEPGRGPGHLRAAHRRPRLRQGRPGHARGRDRAARRT